MACDEYLLDLVKQDHNKVFIRIYAWEKPSFSVGYSQKVKEELNLEKCLQFGYDVVRRPTGGRIVLHKDEIAYTFISHFSSSAEKNMYSDLIGEVFINLLSTLSIKADFIHTGVEQKFQRHMASLCFTFLSERELMINSKKIVGRAVRERRNIRLEQGFLLTNNGYRELVDYLPDIDGAERKTIERELLYKTTSLYDLLRRDVDYNELADLLRVSLKTVLRQDWADYKLDSEDKCHIELIMEKKYANRDWMYKF